MSVLFFMCAGSDLEALRTVFNEKEKELSLAVAKVEELTRQLEDVRKSSKEISNNGQSMAAMELEKLRRELMVCTKGYLFHCLRFFFLLCLLMNLFLNFNAALN